MLVCADLERSLHFYRDVLGLKVVSNDVPHSAVLDLGNGATLTLHPKSDIVAVRPGSLQLGFAVENVDKFATQCVESGVPVFQDPYDESSGRSAVIGDPDGYPIQIAGPAHERRKHHAG